LDRVDSHWFARFGVYPQERVYPFIGQLNLDQMVAFRASRSVSLEDSVWALTTTVYLLQDEVSALVVRYARWTASFAEGSHFPRS